MNTEKDNLINDLVSIIVPIYNTEKFLAECIESILAQTYEKLEIILVDDGSTDHSGQIADEYAKQDNRIRVLHKENQGVSAARNSGIDVSQGEWIAFIDSDDTVNSEYIEVLLGNAHKFGADVSFGISNIMEEDGTKREATIASTKEESYTAKDGIVHLLEADLFGCAMNKLYRASLWKDYRIQTDIRINEDLLANYYCFSAARNIVYTNANRLSSGSASRSGFNEKQFDIVKVTKTIFEDSSASWNETDIPKYAGKRYAGALVSVYKGSLAGDFVSKQKQLISMARKDMSSIVKNTKIPLAIKVQYLILCVCPKIFKLL